jgi:hypothetical protein
MIESRIIKWIIEEAVVIRGAPAERDRKSKSVTEVTAMPPWPKRVPVVINK